MSLDVENLKLNPPWPCPVLVVSATVSDYIASAETPSLLSESIISLLSGNSLICLPLFFHFPYSRSEIPVGVQEALILP